MTDKIGFFTPVVFFIALFVVARRDAARRARRSAAASTPSATASASRRCPVCRRCARHPRLHAVGLCSALVGILLTGFPGQASLGMGDEYLLPSIAVVVVGGALITGGRGHYLGMLGGVLLLTALQTLLAGTTLPYATAPSLRPRRSRRRDGAARAA